MGEMCVGVGEFLWHLGEFKCYFLCFIFEGKILKKLISCLVRFSFFCVLGVLVTWERGRGCENVRERCCRGGRVSVASGRV